MTSILRIKNENGEWVDVVALKGENGKTPVLGVDYFTEAEKQALIAEIKNSLYTYSTIAPEAGVTPLATGKVYFVYE